MLIEAAHRAETAAQQVLTLLDTGGVSCEQLRQMMTVTKRVIAAMTTAQTRAAAVIAKTERHGDGGTEILAETAGLTRREARGQVKTAQTIAEVPSIRDAVAQGRVSQANAKRLADAVKRTSAGAVEADSELLKMAESQRAEQFTKHARRWIAEHQNDGGEADYQRLRAKRSLRIWNDDNGMVELHATFDPLTGQRIGNRLRAEANRLYQNDKKHATTQPNHRTGGEPGTEPANRHGGGSGSERDGRRSFDQCMADAMDNLTSTTATALNPHTATSPDTGTGTGVTGAGTIPDRHPHQPTLNTATNTGTDTHSHNPTNTGHGVATGTDSATSSGTATADQPQHRSRSSTDKSADTGTSTCEPGSGSELAAATSCAGAGSDTRSGPELVRSFADICVVAHVDEATGDLVGQLADGQRLPASVMEQLSCNARFVAVLCNSRGQSIWRTHATRTATEPQRRLLLARWGGCFHCGANPAMCEIHHIVPFARGGETKINNMVPVCWDCHQRIHHNHWQIHKHPDGNHTLHTPDRRHHGPAHAPEQPLLFK